MCHLVLFLQILCFIQFQFTAIVRFAILQFYIRQSFFLSEAGLYAHGGIPAG